MVTLASGTSVWEGIARSYFSFGSPFVPCAEDTVVLKSAVDHWMQGRARSEATLVLLGVTPSIANVNWPAGVVLTGVEQSQAVIRAIWPGDVDGARRSLHATWMEIPERLGACDVIIGDGSLNVCGYPEGIRELTRVVRRSMNQDGLFAIRCYIAFDEREKVGHVLESLRERDAPSVDHFKLRLYLAMQKSAHSGVAVREAYNLLVEHGIDRRFMEENLGWSPASVEPILLWQNSDAVYSFPTLGEFRDLLSVEFDEISIAIPSYELGQHCPTLILRPR